MTVETTAVAVSGRRLAKPFTFEFTTPTTKLLQTHWYRRGGKADAPIVVLMRFNQRVRPEDVLAHLNATLRAARVGRAHAVEGDGRPADRHRPHGGRPLRSKGPRHACRGFAASPVTFRLTNDWDRKAHPPAPDLVALESTTPIPSESWVKLLLNEQLPSPAGDEVPGVPQTFIVEVEPAFFVNDFQCCGAAAIRTTATRSSCAQAVKVTDFAGAVRVTDITVAGTSEAGAKPATPRPRGEYAMDEGTHLTIEDAGFPASRRRAPTR